MKTVSTVNIILVYALSVHNLIIVTFLSSYIYFKLAKNIWTLVKMYVCYS